jgi:hypothetical protein
MGMIPASAKRPAEARGWYERAATSRPWCDTRLRAQALRGVGVNLIDLGELDRAEQAFRQSLELQPDSRLAQDELALIARMRSTGVTPEQLKLNLVSTTPPRKPGKAPDPTAE